LGAAIMGVPTYPVAARLRAPEPSICRVRRGQPIARRRASERVFLSGCSDREDSRNCSR
jgi:hypothetical protein